MIELFWIGGPFFMVPLLLGSFAVVTIAIERFRRFRAAEIQYDDFVEEMEQSISQDGLSGGAEFADQVPGPVAAIWSAGLHASRLPLQIMREKMDSVAITEIQRLERYLPLWGMIDAFDGMAAGLASGVGVNGELIANGIGRALVTTAAGLAVAIPATLLHHWFSHKVDLFIDDIEKSRSDLVELLTRLSPKKTTRQSSRSAEKVRG